MSEGANRGGRNLTPVPHGGNQMVPVEAPVDEQRDDETIDLRQLWITIVKRKWIVISVAAIMLITAVLATILTIPTYRSTATVEISHEGARILRIEDFEAGPRGWQGVEEFRQTQREILSGRRLAEAVVRNQEVENHPELTGELRQRSILGELRALPRTLLSPLRSSENGAVANPNLSEEQRREQQIRRAAARLRGMVSVNPRENSSLFNIQVSSFDPEFAARMANAVVEEYTRMTMQRRYEAGSEAREFLDEQLGEMRISLERSDQALSDFAHDNQIADLDERLDMAKQSLRQLNGRLIEVENDLVQYQTYQRQIENGRVDSLEPIVNNENIQRYEERLDEARLEYDSLSQQFMEDYPALVDARQRMDSLRSQIEQERQRAINRITERYENLQIERDDLQHAVDERESRILALNQRAVQYNILSRELETNRELYDGMLQRMKEIGLTAGLQENNVSMVDQAIPAGSPYMPNMSRNLGIALMLGLMIGVGLALLLEFLDNTVRRIEDLERLADRPVLGLVPLVKLREHKKKLPRSGKDDRRVSHYSAEQPRSAVSEAFRSLRTSLMFSTPEGMPRTLLITSPGPGDGKTTSAINLATVMAQNGSRVLLIDADLRKPKMHRDFKIPQTPGLTNRIARANGGHADQVAIHPTEVDNLYVMPSGTPAPNPAEMLSSKRMEKILHKAGQVFDYIIVDTAPIIGLADSVILSRMVDGVLLVTASGSTGKDNVRSAVKRLRQVQAPLVGMVLNAVDMESPDYAYYSAYYYNYSSDAEDQDTGKAKALTRIA